MKNFYNILGTIFVLIIHVAYFYPPEWWSEKQSLENLLFLMFIACVDVAVIVKISAWLYHWKPVKMEKCPYCNDIQFIVNKDGSKNRCDNCL